MILKTTEKGTDEIVETLIQKELHEPKEILERCYHSLTFESDAREICMICGKIWEIK